MINKQDQETIDRWFKDHKAAYLKDQYSRIIDWRKPSTSSYGVTYVWMGSYMIVTGDLGTTVFQVPAMSFEFFDNCELDYLLGKIVATSSESGNRKGYIWDSEMAKKAIMALKPEGTLTKDRKELLGYVKNDLLESISSSQELYGKTQRLSDDLYLLFGGDWQSQIPMNSYEPCIHISAQYSGLKKAIAQLKEQGVSIVG